MKPAVGALRLALELLISEYCSRFRHSDGRYGARRWKTRHGAFWDQGLGEPLFG